MFLWLFVFWCVWVWLEVGLDGVSEASGVQQASGDVVVEVAEPQGDAPEGLEPAVDGLGGPVRPVGVVEEREHVAHAAFEGAPERGEFGAPGRTAFGGEGFDELGHHGPSLAPVLVRVAGDDPPVDAVREGERPVRGIGEQPVGLLPLPVGARGRGPGQDPPALVERVGPGAAPSRPLAPEPATHPGEPVAGEPDDVERVEDLHSVRHQARGGPLVSGERVHRHDPHVVCFWAIRCLWWVTVRWW